MTTEPPVVEPIDFDVFFKALPTFLPRPENFVKDLREMVKSTTSPLVVLLAMFEENALLKEKTFVDIDFTSNDGVKTAIKLAEEIKALRAVVAFAVTVLNGEIDDNPA